jgi:hypothetical protein
MTENASDALPFEPPEQEDVRLREENARLADSTTRAGTFAPLSRRVYVCRRASIANENNPNQTEKDVVEVVEEIGCGGRI